MPLSPPCVHIRKKLLYRVHSLSKASLEFFRLEKDESAEVVTYRIIDTQLWDYFPPFKIDFCTYNKVYFKDAFIFALALTGL
jgi:hypothetical protein